MTGSPSWQRQALCVILPQEQKAWFYADDSSGDISKAISICKRCPVNVECLHHAMTHDERMGVWGGQTPTERYSGVVVLNRTKAWTKIEQKTCAWCSLPFESIQARQKYCSRTCGKQAHSFNTATMKGKRTCVWCGCTFLSYRADHILCSEACRKPYTQIKKVEDRARLRQSSAS